MQETLFEQYLKKSYRKSEELEGKTMSTEEVGEAFFPTKVAKLVQKYKPKKGNKNAIVLLGPSCCGKTTFGKEFVKQRPFFQFMSMDKCAIEEMENMTEEEMALMMMGLGSKTSDDMGNRRFGQMLEKGHNNIIIDGGWTDVNSRGALLHTLEDLEYNTCIFLFSQSEDVYDKRVRSRVCELIAAKYINMSAAEILRGVNVLYLYAKRKGIRVATAKDLIMQSNEFKNSMERQYGMLANELQKSNYYSQIAMNIIMLGADELYVINQQV